MIIVIVIIIIIIIIIIMWQLKRNKHGQSVFQNQTINQND